MPDPLRSLRLLAFLLSPVDPVGLGTRLGLVDDPPAVLAPKVLRCPVLELVRVPDELIAIGFGTVLIGVDGVVDCTSDIKI